MSDLLDVVYVVRPGDRNEELRYSLRSLRFLAHRHVVIAGHCPPWVRNVIHLPTKQTGTKYANSTANLLAACDDDRLTRAVWLFNDDFFLMAPFPDGIPTLHRGPLSDVIADYARRGSDGDYLAGMRATYDYLLTQDVEEPVSHEMHTPMRVIRARMGALLDRVADWTAIPHKRTLYGNIYGPVGERALDVKVPGPRGDWRTSPLLSTLDTIWSSHPVGKLIRDTHSEPSPYEAPGVSAGEKTISGGMVPAW